MSEFPSGEQILRFLTYMLSRVGLKTTPASYPIFKECNVTDAVPQCGGEDVCIFCISWTCCIPQKIRSTAPQIRYETRLNPQVIECYRCYSSSVMTTAGVKQVHKKFSLFFVREILHLRRDVFFIPAIIPNAKAAWIPQIDTHASAASFRIHRTFKKKKEKPQRIIIHHPKNQLFTSSLRAKDNTLSRHADPLKAQVQKVKRNAATGITYGKRWTNLTASLANTPNKSLHVNGSYELHCHILCLILLYFIMLVY